MHGANQQIRQHGFPPYYHSSYDILYLGNPDSYFDMQYDSILCTASVHTNVTQPTSLPVSKFDSPAPSPPQHEQSTMKGGRVLVSV